MRTAFAAAALLLAGCAAGGVQEREFSAELTGYQVVGGGDLEGTGRASVRLNPSGDRLCWDLIVRGTEPAISASIRRAAAGLEGPEAVELTTPAPDGASRGCTAVPPHFARELSLAPHAFYVAIATALHPNGAIRGQLRGRRPIRARRIRDD